MNKIIKLISFMLIITLCTTACSFTYTKEPETTATEPLTIVEPTPPPTEPPTLPPAPSIEAQTAFVYDLKKHEYLYTKHTKEKIAPASITKLLTACIALDYFTTDSVITVGSEISLLQPNSSVCMILPGHKLTVLDLLYGLLLQSGNDAAYTLAVNVAREDLNDNTVSEVKAVEHFITIMNTYAVDIGMKYSHFTSPDGYDTAEQCVTGEDILALAMHVKKKSTLNMIVSTYSKDMTFISGETITWTNTNQFLDQNSVFYNPYVVGMKTGSTIDAGTCLLTSYNDGDHDLIVFTAGCTSDESRYSQTSILINWAIQ